MASYESDLLLCWSQSETLALRGLAPSEGDQKDGVPVAKGIARRLNNHEKSGPLFHAQPVGTLPQSVNQSTWLGLPTLISKWQWDARHGVNDEQAVEAPVKKRRCNDAPKKGPFGHLPVTLEDVRRGVYEAVLRRGQGRNSGDVFGDFPFTQYLIDGSRYGAHWLLYSGDPLVSHAHSMVTCLDLQNCVVSPAWIVAKARTAAAVRKKVFVATGIRTSDSDTQSYQLDENTEKRMRSEYNRAVSSTRKPDGTRLGLASTETVMHSFNVLLKIAKEHRAEACSDDSKLFSSKPDPLCLQFYEIERCQEL